MATPSDQLDFRLILETPLRQFTPWLASVLIVTWAGYPGVVCVTPLAWLIALRVGLICSARSATPGMGRRMLEAALAGGLLGFLQGILFLIIVPRMGEIKPDERISAFVLTALMIVAGMLAGAFLSAFTAFLFERRRRGA